MHFNSDGTTGFLGKISFFNNFGISVVLILHYQLPFLQSGRLSGKMNWTVVQLDLASLSSFFQVCNLSQKLSTGRHRVFSWNIEVQSKSSPRGRDGFCFEVWLNTERTPQSNSSCLEIDDFGESTTGSVHLEHHFYRNR